MKSDHKNLKGLERFIERVLFISRWIQAPMYLGLIMGLLIIGFYFFENLVHLIMMTFSSDKASENLIIGILELIDLVLLGNLVVIIMFAGYENFVSKLETARESKDRPRWMKGVDFSGLKLKIISSLVAISVIELLKDFLYFSSYSGAEVKAHMSGEIMRIILHLIFLLSGIIFAWMDYIADKRHSLSSDLDD